MSIFLIVSDTHGNSKLLDRVLDTEWDSHFSAVIHLGDDYPDGDWILNRNIPLIRVPGTRDMAYANSMIDNRRFEDVLGWRLFLSHTPDYYYTDLPEDLDPQLVWENGDCDVFCHGHTHKPEIELKDKRVRVNPGHLKSEWDRGYPPTFAKLIVTEQKVQVEIKTVFEKEQVAYIELNKANQESL